ncbi:MAG: proline iminopeptidase-family hydrolase [Saprospiraceae bacterium]
MKLISFINLGLLLFTSIFFTGCQGNKNLSPGEGFIDVDGGKVWYSIVGEGKKTPLLVLHGGPGIPSYYLKSLGALGKDRPVIFYDQLGCGKSDRIRDTSLMNVEHFVKELGTVVNHLGLKNYYLFGHSWGTMLGTDYYLAHPDGIKALILSSPALSISRWMTDAGDLISTLPDSIQQVIFMNEKGRTYDAPDYQQAVMYYYHLFLSRKDPWPADLDSSFAQVGENVYNHMGGPSEFTVTGSLRNYDRTNRLGEIKVPTLFIAGEYDEAKPTTVEYYQSLVPGAKFVLIYDSGHLTTIDQPEKNNQAVIDFLNEIEK